MRHVAEVLVNALEPAWPRDTVQLREKSGATVEIKIYMRNLGKSNVRFSESVKML
jgi:hypothetical protein